MREEMQKKKESEMDKQDSNHSEEDNGNDEDNKDTKKSDNSNDIVDKIGKRYYINICKFKYSWLILHF